MKPIERPTSDHGRPADHSDRPDPTLEAELDEALDESFPASDPLAMTEPGHRFE